ncbi:T6SS effector BTH_I2691 family protein [Pantoea sp. GD03673]|uniref:T6SS effector BTH_I2691 family protein n=1 Tax=Pantoea sp. GD03673 TaxID=2975364 RepID=UPI0024480360|nr:T6SS effector BTH_I2691 family protein [Pantoea sp. GD03673]MDH2067451.1 hypothetical protein [Pantoea sp. GD03673]
MAEFIPDMNNCPMCMVKGPALIPARYAVVTDNITGGIPSWATPANAEPYKLVPGYSYALRAMRQGFIYVFYEISQHWDAWAICKDGSLWKQPSGAYAQPKKKPDCNSPKHQATNLEMMILDEMALEGNTWLAFSPSKWMQETLERYASDADLRKKRMQCLESWQWTTPGNSLGVAAASPGSLESILDYKDSGMTHPAQQLPYNPAIRRISQTEPKAPWYNFEESEVKPQGTIYPWSQSRIGGAHRTMQALKNRHEGKNKYDKDITPLVMAIADPVGIAHELAGFGDDFAALHKAWMDDLSIEFMSDQALNAAENQLHALKNARALKQSDDRVDYNLEMMKKYDQYGHTLSDEVIADWRKKESDRAFQNSEDEFASDWKKYAKKLNLQKRQAFTDCNQRFFDCMAQKLDLLAALRVEWLRNALFVLCSQDFYSTRVEDNLSYLEIVDYAIASLNLTRPGTDFIDKLIDQYSADDEQNLVWRSIMLNNPEVIKDTRSFLKGMEQYKDNHHKADQLAYIALATKLEGKFIKAYAKANDITAKNPTPTSSWSRAMLATDRRLTTLGDRFFSFTRLGKTLDTMNELLSKVLFTASAGVATVGEEVERGVAQLVSADAYRQQMLDNLKQSASGTESKSVKNTYNAYKERFNDFAKTADGKDALKKSRIKLLVFAFNALEYANLLNKTEKDPRNNIVRATLIATFLSTVNVASDVMVPAVEHGLKSTMLTNSIKWAGSVSGSSASTLMLAIDIIGGYKEATGKQRWQFISLSFGKVAADASVAVKALEGLLNFAIEREVMSVNHILFRGVSRILAIKMTAFLATWQVMIAIFIIEQLVIYFSDNDLQDWCEASVFGELPEVSLTSTEKIELLKVRNGLLKKQEDSFIQAVKVIQ